MSFNDFITSKNSPKKQITAKQFEEKVLDKEEIVIVLRVPPDTPVDDYDYNRKAAGNTSITDWVEQRIKPCIKDIKLCIISGDYTSPHGRTKLETLRNGYEK